MTSPVRCRTDVLLPRCIESHLVPQVHASPRFTPASSTPCLPAAAQPGPFRYRRQRLPPVLAGAALLRPPAEAGAGWLTSDGAGPLCPAAGQAGSAASPALRRQPAQQRCRRRSRASGGSRGASGSAGAAGARRGRHGGILGRSATSRAPGSPAAGCAGVFERRSLGSFELEPCCAAKRRAGWAVCCRFPSFRRDSGRRRKAAACTCTLLAVSVTAASAAARCLPRWSGACCRRRQTSAASTAKPPTRLPGLLVALQRCWRRWAQRACPSCRRWMWAAATARALWLK